MLKFLFLCFDKRVASALKVELEEVLNSLSLKGEIILSNGISSYGPFYAIFLEINSLYFDEQKYKRFLREAKKIKKLYL